MHQASVEVLGGSVVDFLQGGVVLEPGAAKPGGEAPVLPLGDLPVHEEFEALHEAQLADIGYTHLVGEGREHTSQFEFLELVQGGGDSTCWFLLWSLN